MDARIQRDHRVSAWAFRNKLIDHSIALCKTRSLRQERRGLIRSLFDEYMRMYAPRDDGLTARSSEDFRRYTVGGDFLVKNRAKWIVITRQDFSQVIGRIRIKKLGALSNTDGLTGIANRRKFDHLVGQQ